MLPEYGRDDIKAALAAPGFSADGENKTIMTAHGNFKTEFQYHLLGPILFFATVLFAAYMTYVLVTGKRLRWQLSKRASRITYGSVLTILLVCWALKLAYLPRTW